MGEGGRYTQKGRQYICHPPTAAGDALPGSSDASASSAVAGPGSSSGSREVGDMVAAAREAAGKAVAESAAEAAATAAERALLSGAEGWVWGGYGGRHVETGCLRGTGEAFGEGWRRRFSYHPLHPLTPNSPQVWPAPLPAESPGILLPGYPPPHLRPHPILSPTPHLSGLASTSSGGFSSLGGVSDHAAALRQLVTLPLRAPHLFAAYRIRPPRGVLLWGPPGSGT